MLRSMNQRGLLNGQLFSIRRAVQQFRVNYVQISEWNNSLLKLAQRKIQREMKKKSEGNN